MFAFQIVNIVMLAMLLYLIRANSTMAARKALMFSLAVILTISMIAVEGFTDFFSALGPEYATRSAFFNAIGFSFSPLIPIVLATVFSTTDTKRLDILAAGLLPGITLALSSPVTGLIFSVSPENVYSRGPLFWVFVVTYVYAFIVFIWANLREMKRHHVRERTMTLLLGAIVLVGTSLQVIFPDLRTAWVCVALTEIMYYINLREMDFRYDPVSETLNRSAFDQQLREMSRYPIVGIVVFDVYKFKQVNDQFGHFEGDQCLKLVARAIEEGFARTGDCYRTGGDEYTVLAPSATESKIEHAIKGTIAALVRLRTQSPAVPAISYGYRVYNRDAGDDISVVLHEADAEMYAYKNKQR